MFPYWDSFFTQEVKTLKKIPLISLDFSVLNALVSPKDNAKINLSFKLLTN